VRLLLDAAGGRGLAAVSEVLEPADLPALEGVALLQVGRETCRTSLLKVLYGRRPVLLKRGPAATVEEWLLAAEYLLRVAKTSIPSCERGIRVSSRPRATRWTSPRGDRKPAQRICR